MPEAVNPYIAGNPVTGTEMFFGRNDVFEFIQKALTGQHRDNAIVLYGQRRTGKTSVMYQMSRHLDARYLCIFIDMSGLAMEGLGGLLWELANYIQRALKRDHQIDLPRLSRDEFMADSRSMFENDFLGRVWSAIGDRHILLMLDEAIRLQEQIQAGKLEKEVFEYLRHLMQAFDRLNFLFSLGSGLEEMEKEYAFLFSVGLYKKISFLERDAATALITQPVKDHYQVAPAAIERILQVTSGHAYYTQLLCHSLFNRWQQQRQPQVQVADVNAILDEVVERGLAVLKHVWEESTSGEKAVLAGLAACMGERNHPVGLGEVDRVWAQHGVTLPPGEKARAIKSLLARDIIVGQDKYAFTVDLQRQWALKYERVEWVKEEITSDLQQWSLEQAQPVPPQPSWRGRAIWIAAGVGLMIVVALLVINAFASQRAASSAQVATSDAEKAILKSQLDTSEASNAVIQAALATRDAVANRPAAEATAAESQFRSVVATAYVKPAEIKVVDAAPLLDRINQLRKDQGLGPLLASSQLSAAALQHSQDMANTGNISHVGSDGSTFEQRARTAGYAFAVNEIIYEGGSGSASLDAALAWWMNNAVSRDLLLSNRYAEIGIGIATDGALTYYTVDLGGQPATSTPTAAPTPAPTPTRPAPPTPAGPTPIAVTTAIDLLAYARSATWSNSSGDVGLWLDVYPESSTPQTDRGFAALVPGNRAWASGREVGNQLVLETHPQAAPVGEIRGDFRLRLPAQGAKFSATLEFLMGAEGSDGVHVEIWWMAADGTGPGDKLAEADVNYNSPPTGISADLGSYSGQTGVLRLRISPKRTAGADWLTWRDVKVTPKS